MRDVRFNDDVVKELRHLVRNSNLGNEFKAALTKIYQSGYDNALKESTKQIRRALNAHKSANNGDHDDGIGVQFDSGVE